MKTMHKSVLKNPRDEHQASTVTSLLLCNNLQLATNLCTAAPSMRTFESANDALDILRNYYKNMSI